RARKCGAPEAACRMMIASGRIAASVFKVSTSDSPLDTLEAEAVMEMASAPRRFAAISKLVRVRVEGSKNKLTTMRPRSTSRVFCERWKYFARSRMVSISARSRGSIPRSPAGMRSDFLHQQNLFDLVHLAEFHFDDLVGGGLHG